VYVKEIVVRYRLRRVAAHRSPQPCHLSTPSAAAIVVLPILQHEIIEVCGVLCLSVHCEVVAYHELSRGTLDCSIVHPRDVFRTALLTNAASVVIAHNHPSGDVAPSPDDVALTTRLRAAGQLLGIPLSDHLIVAADGGYFSFRESGMLWQGGIDMLVKIQPNEKGNPPGKLADAELHFSEGALGGMKLIGFAVWERRTGGGWNVTFPARQYSVNGERRSFALLRPITDTAVQDRVRDLILEAYAAHQTASNDGW
jgi:DNA repair protein RadC